MHLGIQRTSILLLLLPLLSGATPAQFPLVQPPSGSQGESRRLLKFGTNHIEWIPERAIDILRYNPDSMGRDALRAAYPHLLRDVSDHAIDILDGRERKKLFGPGFSDITDFGLEAEGLLTEDLLAPALSTPNPSAHPEVGELLKLVSARELEGTVTSFTGTFRTRFYKSKIARDASIWVHNEMRAVLGNNGTVSYVDNTNFNQPNVVGRIPARGSGDKKSDDEEIIIFGGHLDSTCGFWCGREGKAPGADDDASGVAVVLSVLRIFSESGWRGKYAIEGHAYAGEEGGLLGSQQLARAYAKSGKKVRGMLNLEMVGWQPITGTNENKTSTITVMTDPNPEMSAHMSAIVKAYVPTAESRATRCGYGCSDHFSWSDAGYPVVCLAAWGPGDENLNPNYHSSTDTSDQLDYERMADFVKATLAWIVEVAG